MARFEYSLAAGYNNAAGFVNVETIKPVGDVVYMWAPTSIGGYSPGAKRLRLDGVEGRYGKASTIWTFDLMTCLAFKHLNTTYCNSSYSGKVTIRTRVGVSTYANFNAIMSLDEENQQRVVDNNEWFEQVQVRFTRMVAI